jgi:hypothetical protein
MTQVAVNDSLIHEALRLQAGRSLTEIIESALSEYLHRMAREGRDLELINMHAERLNEEALDVLSYQRPL